MNALRVVSVLLIALGLGWQFAKNADPYRVLSLPMAPLTVPEGLREATRVPASPGALAGQNLLLVTLDTVRPDRLGLYGNASIETPRLDALGRAGVVFSNAVATTSTTLPTHASILSGLYPHRHRARVNSRHALPEEVETLAEVLGAAGYRTAAFVSSRVLDARYGLDQGFDHYDAEAGARGVAIGYSERRAEDTTDAAIAWLAANAGDGPWFLWVHYYDPHVPYAAPDALRRRSTNEYDAEIAYVDRELGRLLDAALDPAGRATLVAVTADHGEALGEHGEQVHGVLVQEATIRIPLVLAATAGLEGGVHVPTRVSQVDLLPTLASLLGVEAPDGLDGVDLTGAVDPARPLLSEAVYGHAHYGWAPIAGLYRGDLKYVAAPDPALYDLAADPLERRDLEAERPEDARALAALLARTRGPDADRLPASDLALPADEVERLRALGYVAGGPTVAAPRTDGPDPHRMLAPMTELLTILGAIDVYPTLSPLERFALRLRGRPVVGTADELVDALEAFAEARPDFAPTWRYLAPAYEAVGRHTDAERARARLVEIVAAGEAR